MIEKETVLHVAKLARLAIDENEIPAVAEQMNKIVNHVEQLQAVNTDGVEPTAYMESARDALRDDVPRASLSPEVLLANGPSAKKGHFAIPKVIG